MKGFYYEQSTGTFSVVNGSWRTPLFIGYAGVPDCRNDPDCQHEKARGPLPRGNYTLRTVAHNRFAHPAIRLDPSPSNEMFGRSGFYIHGDNRTSTASTGCIILGRGERTAINELMKLGFDQLQVGG